jgi:hypothetical protein
MSDNDNLFPMIEVAIERRFDVLRKSWESLVFTKLYQSLRISGLLAKLSDKDFKTLICLSTFMDAEKNCFPSQEALAKALGISRTAVTERINSLLSFRWQGRPLISAKKIKTWKGILDTTVYSILPESGLHIFHNEEDSSSYDCGACGKTRGCFQPQ